MLSYWHALGHQRQASCSSYCWVLYNMIWCLVNRNGVGGLGAHRILSPGRASGELWGAYQIWSPQDESCTATGETTGSYELANCTHLGHAWTLRAVMFMFFVGFFLLDCKCITWLLVFFHLFTWSCQVSHRQIRRRVETHRELRNFLIAYDKTLYL